MIGYDLHNHLYGALTLDDLHWMASRKPIDLSFYIQSYERTHGKKPKVDELFSPGNRSILEDQYYLTRTTGFDDFQTRFDLIISLSRTDPMELEELSRRILLRQNSHYAEYRMMFNPFLGKTEYQEKLDALVSGFQSARSGAGKVADLAMSIPRRPDLANQFYQWIRDYQKRYPEKGKEISGIDFCAQEMGDPPVKKKEFLAGVLEDNRKEFRSTPLAILYHAGEIFSDKTLESAIRWVVQAVQMGSHRIGHGIALGYNPQLLLGTERMEPVGERLDHIDFLLENQDSLKEAGLELDGEDLRREKNERLKQDPGTRLPVKYDEKRVREVRKLQVWACQILVERDVPVEVCPTSNLRIAGLGSMKNHPIKFFREQGVPIVPGTDDPGILMTDLNQELELIAGELLDNREMESILANSTSYLSRILASKR